MPKPKRIESDWLDWYAALSQFQHDKKGRAPYLPSPAEIPERCRQVLWLERQGFCRSFIANIMEFDHPCFERVKQMVGRYGPEETYRRCSEFLFDTDYKQKEEYDDGNC